MVIWDIHNNYPNVKEAMKELETRIEEMNIKKQKVLKVIHGYGSSGTGGQMKKAFASAIKSKFHSGKIELGICCDMMNILNNIVTEKFRFKYSHLVSKEDKRSNNPGITYFFL